MLKIILQALRILLFSFILISQNSFAQETYFRETSSDSVLIVKGHKSLDLESLFKEYLWGDTITFGLEVANCTVVKPSFLHNKVFMKKVEFSDVIFENRFGISQFSFLNEVRFEKIIWKGDGSLSSCIFKKSVDISNSQIDKFYFDSNTIEDHIRFSDNEGSASFFLNRIKIMIAFGNQFRDDFSFTNNDIEYLKLGFNTFNNFHFGRNRFPYDSNSLDIISPIFNGNTYIRENKLPKYLEFSGVIAEKEINLISASNDSLKRPIFLDLQGSDISKIKLLYAQPYFLSPPNYEINKDEFNATYQALIAKQKHSGFHDSYVKLDKEYKGFYYRHMIGGLWGNLNNWIRLAWWGYGHDKHLIVRNILFGLGYFFIVTVFFLNDFLSKGYDIQNISERLNSTPMKILASKRLILSFFYISLIFFGFHLSFEKLRFQHLGITSFLLLVHFYGLLCTVFLVNYIILS